MIKWNILVKQSRRIEKGRLTYKEYVGIGIEKFYMHIIDVPIGKK